MREVRLPGQGDLLPRLLLLRQALSSDGEGKVTEPKLPLEDVLWHAFRQNYHLDHSNAAIHCAEVRYSPITFRIAEHLLAIAPHRGQNRELRDVLGDVGAYVEDPGR